MRAKSFLIMLALVTAAILTVAPNSFANENQVAEESGQVFFYKPAEWNEGELRRGGESRTESSYDSKASSPKYAGTATILKTHNPVNKTVDGEKTTISAEALSKIATATDQKYGPAESQHRHNVGSRTWQSDSEEGRFHYAVVGAEGTMVSDKQDPSNPLSHNSQLGASALVTIKEHNATDSQRINLNVHGSLAAQSNGQIVEKTGSVDGEFGAMRSMSAWPAYLQGNISGRFGRETPGAASGLGHIHLNNHGTGATISTHSQTKGN